MKRFSVFSLLTIAAGVAVAVDELPLPEVPSDLRDLRLRAEYVMDHFWDKMEWNDTTLTRDKLFLEQNFVNFTTLFQLSDSVGVSRAAGIMFEGASVDPIAYKALAGIARQYLFEPDSPSVDEESFLAIADRLMADGRLPEADLLRTGDARQSALMNRVGHMSADFDMIDRNGSNMTLHGAAASHDKTIVMFYDPDCRDCGELERYLAGRDLGGYGVVMVSPYGEQDGLWASHAATMPSDWIVARPVDDDFEDAGLYDIRITPTVLLLDREGKVVAKNLNLDKLDSLLGR